ncbi:sensor histidine kinase [Cohnella faecalis]|uniref:HAMP domain-containing protein n=1 Tax=Cohnella faecalis TaxID=2315694 RepID=A0A398CLM6_9BACL|nr:histidine kinase [Cohnella faecalis]RIE01758.1 HAMP domain-containing protein [Cohnella faecalis]
MNLITKMILLIAMLMIPVILLFTHSNRQSIDLVKSQIDLANESRLEHFLEEIEGTLEQFSSYSGVIMTDPDFAEFAGGSVPADRYQYAELMQRAERKLRLFSLSTRWVNRINLYFPQSRLAVSSDKQPVYDDAALAAKIDPNWRLRPVVVNGISKRAFTRYFVDPYAGYADLKEASIVIEVELMEDNIVAKLDSFKTKGINEPFLVTSKGDVVLSTTSDASMARRIIEASGLSADSRMKERSTIRLNGKQYLVYTFRSAMTDMFFVEYVPLEDILAPVTRARMQFYLTVGLLVLLGVAVAVVLYVNVQVPIRLLTRSVEKLKDGQFSVRVRSRTGPDFERLVSRFNDMAAEIQHLVEKVYREKIRSKEAVMKQLQSQINPHFLYNSMAYIISMVNMNRPSQAVHMSHELADYFRYTTRNSEMETTLGEELAFVTTYLSIMEDQLDKISHTIELPDSMLGCRIPRLLIQPLVENAIVHGLEEKLEPGHIRISGETDGEWYRLSVSDDGVGMASEELELLNLKLALPDPDGDSFGLWNVKWRLRYQFGEGSDMTVASSDSGGLTIALRWRERSDEAGDGNGGHV